MTTVRSIMPGMARCLAIAPIFLSFFFCSKAVAVVPVAAPADRKTGLDLSLGVAQFRWQEYDFSGQRLLSEHGPIFTAVVDIEPDTGLRPLVLRIRGGFFSGNIDYDGQVEDLTNPGIHTFVSSETSYQGGHAALHLGYRVRAGASLFSEFFVRAGATGWVRDISSSIDASGKPVGGFREDYVAYYGTIGFAFDDMAGPVSTRFSVGARLPYQVNEDVVVSNQSITLHPDGLWSAFAGYRVNLGDNFIDFTYQGMKFGASPPSAGVFQPRSQMDRFSVRLGRRF